MMYVEKEKQVNLYKLYQFYKKEVYLKTDGKDHLNPLLFASSLFEMGCECEIKFGSVHVKGKQNTIPVNVFYPDLNNQHCWIIYNDMLIDCSLGIIDFWQKKYPINYIVRKPLFVSQTLLFDVKVVEYETLSVKKANNKIPADKFCKNNKNLYEDLDLPYYFTDKAMKIAGNYTSHSNHYR